MRRLVVEAREVDVRAVDAVVVVETVAVERGHDAAQIQANLLAQIAADDVAAVPDAVGMLLRGRVEQDPRRVDAARAHDHDPASTWRSSPVTRSKYWTPFARPRSSTRIRAATAFERISSFLVSSASGADDRPCRRRTRCRSRVRTCRSNGTARRRCGTWSCWRGGCGRTACRPWGRAASAGARRTAAPAAACVIAARQHLGVVVSPAHADQLIDLVVVRRHVGVADGPRNLPAVAWPAPGSPCRCSAG